MNVTLKTVVFLGSGKNITPPWGGPKRLGNGIYEHVVNTLKSRNRNLSGQVINHEVTVFDPLEVFGKDGALHESGAHLQFPQFYYGEGQAPESMTKMRDVIRAADCIVIISPEYNHSVPPALSSMLGHFGGSNFAMKPSAIITYSMGPWGGARGAMALRPLLSELGCIPISKLTHYPVANDHFDADGTLKEPTARIHNQLPAQLNELEWVALAYKNMKATAPNPQET